MSEKKSLDGLPIRRDKKTGMPIWSDVREFALKYSIGVNRISKFLEGLMEKKIFATRCKNCGEMFFPPQMDCPRCRKSDMEWVELSGEGELEAYSIQYIKPKTFQHYEDYVIAIGKLKEGVKVFTWLRIDDVSKIKIGMKLKLIVNKRLPEGYLVYEFIPA